MGCGAVKTSMNAIQKSLTNLSQSRSNLEASEVKRNANRRRSCRALYDTGDFWGTMPFYVLNQKIQLISAEVDDESELKNIFTCVLGILKDLCENFEDESRNFIKISDKKYQWINKYGHGLGLIKAIGLKIEKNTLYIMKDVEKVHLINKVKEVKYSIKLIGKPASKSMKGKTI